MNADLQACGEIVERGDIPRFMAAMAAPLAARKLLFPLYAFNIEVARAPWMSDEPMIAEMRLQWWRDMVENVEKNRPFQTHNVMTPLQSIIREHGLPIALFDQMIAARRWDIYRDAFEDAAHFEEYLDRTSGHLMWLSAKVLGAKEALQPACRAVGRAMGLANLLLAVPALEAAGRLPLVDGRPGAVADLAKAAFEDLQAQRRVDFGPAVPALRAAWAAAPVLKQAQNAPHLVAEDRLGPSEFYRKITLLQKSILRRW